MGINSNQALAILRQLANEADPNVYVSRSDVEKFMNQEDKSGDGVVTSDEFSNFYKSSDDYQQLEDDFLAAFEVLSKADGSISDDDILSAMGNPNGASGEIVKATGDEWFLYNGSEDAKDDI